MEIILSVGFLVAIWLWVKYQEGNTTNHCNTYEVDWGKVNEDRIMNDLSNSQVNRNIVNGKYDTGKKYK